MQKFEDGHAEKAQPGPANSGDRVDVVTSPPLSQTSGSSVKRASNSSEFERSDIKRSASQQTSAAASQQTSAADETQRLKELLANNETLLSQAEQHIEHLNIHDSLNVLMCCRDNLHQLQAMSDELGKGLQLPSLTVQINTTMAAACLPPRPPSGGLSAPLPHLATSLSIPRAYSAPLVMPPHLQPAPPLAMHGRHPLPHMMPPPPFMPPAAAVVAVPPPPSWPLPPMPGHSPQHPHYSASNSSIPQAPVPLFIPGMVPMTALPGAQPRPLPYGVMMLPPQAAMVPPQSAMIQPQSAIAPSQAVVPLHALPQALMQPPMPSTAQLPHIMPPSHIAVPPAASQPHVHPNLPYPATTMAPIVASATAQQGQKPGEAGTTVHGVVSRDHQR